MSFWSTGSSWNEVPGLQMRKGPAHRCGGPLRHAPMTGRMLPAGLCKARDKSLVSHLTEGDTADHELSVYTA